MLYTIGEIYRQKLLRNHLGEPYKDKGTVARIVGRLNYTVKKTAWGEAKCLSLEDIKVYNRERLSQ